MSEPAANLSELLQHSAWVRRLARALVLDAAEADDVVQDTWVEVLRNPPRGVHKPRSWLGGVVRHVALRRLRKDARRGRRERDRLQPRPPSHTDDLVMRAEMQRKVLDAALALDEPHRSTVLKRYFDGRSCSDIARDAGMPASTVRNRLKQALALLRGKLGSSRQAWVALLALAGMASAATGATTALAAKETATMMTGSKLALAVSALAVAGVVITSIAADDLATTAATATTMQAHNEAAPAGAERPKTDAMTIEIEEDAAEGLDPLENRVAELERNAKPARARGRRPARGPSMSGPKQIAEALGLTDAQREQMAEIYGRQGKRYAALRETPNAEGITPNEYIKPLQKKYAQAFEKKDFAAVHEAMLAMGAVWEWKLPGTNETYREASDRYLLEAKNEFIEILTRKQRKLYADDAHMGSFAVPFGGSDGSKAESISVVTVVPEQKK